MKLNKGDVLHILFLFSVVLGLFLTKGKSYSSLVKNNIEVQPPPLAAIDPKVIKILFLGFNNIYEDFIYIWSLQHLLDEQRKDKSEEIISAILVAARHQPRMESFYMLTCFVFALDFEKPELCQQISKMGLSAFPESWRLPMVQGFIHAFVLEDPAQGAAYYSLAASRKKSPPYVARVAKKLLEKNELSREDIKKGIAILPSSLKLKFIELIQDRKLQREGK